MSKQEADTVSSDQLVSKQAIVMSYNRITKQASNQSFNHCKEFVTSVQIPCKIEIL
jgi:hypothetical protein